MTSIWDIAVVTKVPDPNAPWPYNVIVHSIPGGKSGASVSAVASMEEGAATLMSDGFEPFGATRVFGPPIFDNVWFRREVKKLSISIGPLHWPL